jgi:hypothetical protein
MQPNDLYGLPLEEFVAKRGELARELRGDGRREEAKAVTALRKPSVAAWAVNQLVRTQGKAVDELLASGDELTDTQAEVLAGRQDASALRDAAEQERGAVDKLTDLARGLLTADGQELSATVVDRVAETLHAAALDGDVRAAVSEGALVRELRHVGLGGGLAPGVAPAAPARKAAAPGKPKTKSKSKTKSEAGPRADPKAADRARADARRAARIAEGETRREADRTTRALKIAQERHERAAQALEEAEQALRAATSEARAADQAHARAQKALDAL